MSLNRVCRKCGKIEHETKFFSKAHNCVTCLDCQKDNKKKLGKSNKKINNQLKKRYNITLDDYNQLLVKQENKCAICKTDILELNTRLHVDHCHKTLKIRGLLCYNCNSGLGRFKDNVDILQNAINYLNASN